MQRRTFLAGSMVGLSSLSWPRWALGRPGDLFSLGIASGDVTTDSVILWTRLAPEPMAVNGGLGDESLMVHWALASDPEMTQIVQQGAQLASPGQGHAIHIDVQGLSAGRDYWYRFTADDQASTIGRTRTLPADGAESARFVTTSCQNYTHGYFVAYDHMVADDPDFVVHLGDYIYDTSFGETFRQHDAEAIPRTLDEFRRRHALYKTDASLQRAHAQLPFFTVIDNHDAIEDNNPAQYEMRAAAYQAWYEHMPVRGFSARHPNRFDMHRLIDVGGLMQISLLDTRQFRDQRELCRDNMDQAIGFGNYRERCDDLFTEERSMLGAVQEAWLYEHIRNNRARWNVIASSGPVTPFRVRQGDEDYGYIGSWDAYPANRARMTNAIRQSRTGHPLILSGDLHSFWAMDGSEMEAPSDNVPAVEFVTSSLSANWPPPLSKPISENLVNNPQVAYYEGAERGYLLHEVDRSTWTTRYRAAGDARRKDVGIRDIRTFRVDHGQPGLTEVSP